MPHAAAGHTYRQNGERHPARVRHAVKLPITLADPRGRPNQRWGRGRCRRSVAMFDLADHWIAPIRNVLAMLSARLQRDIKRTCPRGVSENDEHPHLSTFAGPAGCRRCTGGGAVWAPGSAPAAHADATDDAFVAALHSHGITHDSNQSAVAAGHFVCHQLDMGKRRSRSRPT